MTARTLRAVRVWWRDSSGYAPWQALDDAAKEAPALCESVGWLLARTRRHVVLVQSVSRNDRGNATLVIPAECVTRLRYLR